MRFNSPSFEQQPPRRLMSNPNLSLAYGSTYRGLPIIKREAPFVQQYLDRTYAIIQRALMAHPRLLAIRFDLRFPDGLEAPDGAYANTVVQRFVDALKYRVRSDRQRAAQHNRYAHDTTVEYVWAREYGDVCGRPHYHFLLLLNRDAYHRLGKFGSGQMNMMARIQAAWASALKLPEAVCAGLVHVPDNPLYSVDRKDGDEGLCDLFHRASYLCKARSKRYGDWTHAFGSSRK